MMDLNKDMFVIKGKNVEKMETISRPSLSFWQDAWRRFRKNKAAFVGLCIILVYVLLAIFAPMLSHYGFSTMDAAHQHAAPSAAHWFGTDATGRDQWVRTWMGARVSLSIGLFAATINMCVGAVIGGFCGFYGGKLDMIVMRIVDILYGIPSLIITILSLAARLFDAIEGLCGTNASQKRIAKFFLWTYLLALAALVAGAIMAVATEIGQSLTTYRSGDAWDFVADASGLGLAFIFVLIIILASKRLN